MPLATGYQPKSEVRLYVGTETTFGTATIAGGTWKEYLVKEIGALPQFSVAAESIARRSGSFLESDGGVIQNPCVFEGEIEVTFYATKDLLTALCGWAFEDASDPAVLTGAYVAPTTWNDATAVGSALPVTLLFKDAGQVNDLKYTSCVCKRMEIMGDVTADGGLWLAKATFYTAYKPIEEDLDPSSAPTIDVSAVRKMCQLITDGVTIDGEDQLISSFNVVIEREVGRLPIKTAATYVPFGYTMGPFIVTGSLHSPKTDAQTVKLIEESYDNTTVEIVLTISTEASCAITLESVKLDNSQITEDDQTLGIDFPFKALTLDSGGSTSDVFSLANGA